MARLVLTEILSLGVSDDHKATDWQISTDPEFNNILVDIVEDRDNLYYVKTPIRNSDGTIRSEESTLYARSRFLIGSLYTPWYYLPECDPSYLLSLDAAGRHQLLSEIEEINIY